MRLTGSRQHAPKQRIATVLIVAGCFFLGGCYDEMERYTTVEQPSGGDAGNGAKLIEQYGCGACHFLSDGFTITNLPLTIAKLNGFSAGCGGDQRLAAR